MFIFSKSANGNHIRHISWSGSEIGIWQSEQTPDKALRTVADDIIVYRHGSLLRIASDGTTLWSQEITPPYLDSSVQFYIQFDISNYVTSMVAPYGDILVGKYEYKGRFQKKPH